MLNIGVSECVCVCCGNEITTRVKADRNTVFFSLRRLFFRVAVVFVCYLLYLVFCLFHSKKHTENTVRRNEKEKNKEIQTNQNIINKRTSKAHSSIMEIWNRKNANCSKAGWIIVKSRIYLHTHCQRIIFDSLKLCVSAHILRRTYLISCWVIVQRITIPLFITEICYIRRYCLCLFWNAYGHFLRPATKQTMNALFRCV